MNVWLILKNVIIKIFSKIFCIVVLYFFNFWVKLMIMGINKLLIRIVFFILFLKVLFVIIILMGLFSIDCNLGRIIVVKIGGLN